jgi:hypothetical protein
MKPRSNVQTVVSLILLSCLLISIGGCGPSQPPPKVGVKNWRPSGIGGPVEVRPLPPADRVVAEWEAWLASDATQKGRVYETTLLGASNQTGFVVEVQKGDTPLGRPEHTYVRFLYKDPTNGVYEFSWHRLGRHTGDYLRLGNSSRTVWVRLNSVANRPGIPLLQIEAFEGLESDGGIIAERGRASITKNNPGR